jgi:hypothetical protein
LKDGCTADEAIALPECLYMHSLIPAYTQVHCTTEPEVHVCISYPPSRATSPCMVLFHGSEHAFAPALLPLSPANLPASPRQLTVRTCTRHHSIPTPDEDWSEVSPIQLVHLFRIITISSFSSLYILSYRLTLAVSIPQRPVRLRSPRARTASHRVALIRSHQQTHVIATVASKLSTHSPTTTKNKTQRPAPFCRRPQPSTTQQQHQGHTADRSAQY